MFWFQVTENGEMKCGMENGLGGIPWLGEFASVNDSAPLQETDSQDSVDLKPGAVSCSLEESQKFDSFFSSFMTDVREFFLPPERHRFGLVSEKSLLSPLGVEDSGSWSVMLYYNGCPSCSRILKEGDDMKRVLQMEKSIVTEVSKCALSLPLFIAPYALLGLFITSCLLLELFSPYCMMYYIDCLLLYISFTSCSWKVMDKILIQQYLQTSHQYSCLWTGHLTYQKQGGGARQFLMYLEN